MTVVRTLMYGVWHGPASTLFPTFSNEGVVERAVTYLLQLVWLAGVIVLCLWIHTAYVRARNGVPDARFSPGWAVGCWFVPVVSLWAPLLVLRHLWQLSRSGAEWRAVKPPIYLVAWWVAYVVPLLFVPSVVVIVFVAHDSRDEFIQSMFWPNAACAIASAVLAIRIVKEITGLQRERLGVD